MERLMVEIPYRNKSLGYAIVVEVSEHTIKVLNENLSLDYHRRFDGLLKEGSRGNKVSFAKELDVSKLEEWLIRCGVPGIRNRTWKSGVVLPYNSLSIANKSSVLKGRNKGESLRNFVQRVGIKIIRL